MRIAVIGSHTPVGSNQLPIPFALTLACVIAALALVNTRFAILACLGLLLAMARPSAPEKSRQAFLFALGTLLCGYVFLGKGFAYLGMPPVYVGEAVLAIGVILVAPTATFKPLMRSQVFRWFVAFALWGAICSAPYVPKYGLDVFRDGVIWGYGAFAVLVAACLLGGPLIERVPQFYSRLVPLMLLWAPVSHMLRLFAGHLIPVLPSTQISILHTKPGDTGVHLAGIAAFLLLGLRRRDTTTQNARAKKFERIYWSAWLIGFLFVASGNRGALMSIVIALSVLFVFRELRASVWLRLISYGAAATALALFLNVEIETPIRTISPNQVVSNFLSVFTDSESELQGTKEWRLEWWNDIVDYTVFGPYRWTGKGYGINLAADDGRWNPGEEIPLRSPHNAHMTILARSGVPGILLWVGLQAAFATGLVRAYFRCKRRGDRRWARLNLWVLAYWTAYLVNGTFDVFLEGPQGGIWFWSLFGFGIAAMEQDRQGGRQQQRGHAHASARRAQCSDLSLAVSDLAPHGT